MYAPGATSAPRPSENIVHHGSTKRLTRHRPHLRASIHVRRRHAHSAGVRHRLHIRARVHRSRRRRHTLHHRLTRVIPVRPSVNVRSCAHGSLHGLLVVARRRHGTLRRWRRLLLLDLSLLLSLLTLLLSRRPVLRVRVRHIWYRRGNVLRAMVVGSRVGAGRVRRLPSRRREELVEALAAERPHRRCGPVRSDNER